MSSFRDCNNRIYVDHAATTPIKEDVLTAMMPFLTSNFGNPSSIYQEGQIAMRAVEKSRAVVSKFINAKEKELYFTSGGTEADNWAIRGVARANKNKGMHIITSSVEHHAVYKTCKDLEADGYQVTYLKVDEYGMIKLEELENAIRKDTILITIMFANNEVGTVMPVKKIGEIAKKYDVIFHTDAVQALSAIPIDVEELGIDLMSMSSHKIYGPKGIGALYIKEKIKISNVFCGGAQEKDKRPGTENVANIVGFAKAVELLGDVKINARKMKRLSCKMIEKITNGICHVKLNGHPEKRLPGNVNISFRYIEGESLLLKLNNYGISASSGSACTSGSLDPSHVLLAMQIPHEIAHGSLRITFGEKNTTEDVDYIYESLVKIVQQLRDWSPLSA